MLGRSHYGEFRYSVQGAYSTIKYSKIIWVILAICIQMSICVVIVRSFQESNFSEKYDDPYAYYEETDRFDIFSNSLFMACGLLLYG